VEYSISPRLITKPRILYNMIWLRQGAALYNARANLTKGGLHYAIGLDCRLQHA